MPAPTQTLYDVLGVSSQASRPEIAKAYNRLVEEFGKATTAPDPRREALIRSAYATLSDDARRDEYDAALAARASESAKSNAKRIVPIAVAAVVILAAAGYFIARKPAAPAVPSRSAQQILADLPRAVGRVQVLDVSGSARTAGLAFAIGDRLMATTCSGLVANAQIVVALDQRDRAARLSIADEELGICKLAVDAPVTFALPIAAAEPKAGDRVFVPAMNAAGELTLAEGTVKSIVVEPKRRLVELTAPGAIANGTPILDSQGSVIGVTTLAHDYGAGRNLALPAALVQQAQSRGKSP